MSMKKDLLIVLGLSLLLIATIASASAWLFGDDSTGERINVVHNDSTFHFYDSGSVPVTDGYYYAIVVNGTEYFLDKDMATKLHDADISHSFTRFYDLDQLYNYGETPFSYRSFDDKFPFTYFHVNQSEIGKLGDTEFECDADFTIEYKIGEVGSWNQEKIITKIIKSDGTEI